jgi:hypothetical protein
MGTGAHEALEAGVSVIKAMFRRVLPFAGSPAELTGHEG